MRDSPLPPQVPSQGMAALPVGQKVMFNCSS
jgi:hypothetical protein